MQSKRREFIKAITMGGMGFLLSCTKEGKILRSTPLTQSAASDAVKDALSADYVQFNSYGQSLAVGGDAGKLAQVISVVQKYDSVMPDLGVRSMNYPKKTKATSFVPLIEQLSSDGTMGETLCSGACEMFAQSVNDEKTFQLHGVASGEGGQSAADLSKGTSNYTRMINDFTAANSIATGMGKTFAVGAIGWTQGEKDIALGTDYNTYKSEILQLNTDVNTDVPGITGQSSIVPFIIGQTSSQNRSTASMNNPITALVQLDLSMNNPNFTMATPMYMMDFLPDNTHLSDVNYRILASYYGYAMKRFLMDGVKNFIYPLSSQVSGYVVHITFNVPVTPLVFDTVQVADPGSYGFTAKDFFGNTIKINSVQLTSDDTVKLTCARTPSSITYAINGKSKKAGRLLGPRGCLRDSQGDTLVFDPGGTNWPLYNWTPIFQMIL